MVNASTVYAHIVAGGEHALAILKTAGSGNQTNDQFIAEAATPGKPPIERALPAGDAQVATIAAGAYHTLVATSMGCLYAWGVGVFQGSNARDGCIPALGQRGALDEVTTPTRVHIDGGEKAKALAAGAYHSVVLTESRKVLTFGAAQLGQLGRRLTRAQTDGSGLPVDDTPAEVSGLPASCAPVRIGAAFYNTYVLCKGKGAYCTGENQNGQCGASRERNIHTMSSIPELEGEALAQLDGGYCHTLALTDDGRVLSMGCGEDGQRGCGVIADDETSVGAITEVVLPGKAKSVAAGLNHSLALTHAGDVFAWGSNEYGQLGVDGDEPRASPVRVEGLPNDRGVPVHISAGSTHSHVLYPDGSVYSFGGGGNGQLMDGSSSETQGTPIRAVAPQRQRSV